MSDYDALVARLRAWQDLSMFANNGWELPKVATAALSGATGKAADAITRLQAEVVALRKERDAEREACAKVMEMSMPAILLMAGEMTAGEQRTVRAVLKGCAAAIRARSATEG